MAFKPVNLIPGIGKLKYVATPSVSFRAGEILIRNFTTGLIATATSTAYVSVIEAISTKTETTSSGTVYIEAVPIGGITYVVADTNADTADQQLNKSHALTSSILVNNTSTHTATSAGVFTAISIVGTGGTRKLFGYLTKVSTGN